MSDLNINQSPGSEFGCGEDGTGSAGAPMWKLHVCTIQVHITMLWLSLNDVTRFAETPVGIYNLICGERISYKEERIDYSECIR